MNVVYLLKICVLAAFVGTFLTGIVFVIHSSDEQLIKNHVKDIYRKLPISGDRSEAQKAVIKPPKKMVEAVEGTEKKPPSSVVSSDKVEPSITLKSTTKAAVSTTLTTTTTTTHTIEPAVLKELKEINRSPSVHIFYYPWYGNPTTDSGRYYHWNHDYLKPWNSMDKHKYPEGKHKPPGDIAASFYPLLGPYSSRDDAVIERHMKWISSSGVDVIAVSWYPKGKADSQGYPWDSLMPALLNATDKFKMKLAFHLEPYDSRTVETIREDIKYIVATYGSHPAFYRTVGKSPKQAKELPLFYVYDSYRIPANEWKKITTAEGAITIRNTEYDAYLIGLCIDEKDKRTLKDSNFDGLYTYFAADGFSYGSSMSNWPSLSAFCARENLLFIPSVSPGYNDMRVRPWNGQNTRERNRGDYYKEHFKMAHTAKADIVSITSFNEWHEGTQIEPAVSFADVNNTGYIYPQYEKGPEQYLEITLEMIKLYFSPHSDSIPAAVAKIV